ncbi:hypothetical protein SAZ_07955 [Streptomyces noursei ZPM]|nr:hypothetical protein SAZ_07955 [Streptomyces noursei ZPM]EPY92642.1 hypothetical protein K530_52085 [Streptomyces noursei CCRC 11814]EXU86060.1 hypothetical protein P354_04495 [Streptomyces noursei PD-1]
MAGELGRLGWLGATDAAGVAQVGDIGDGMAGGDGLREGAGTGRGWRGERREEEAGRRRWRVRPGAPQAGPAG